MSSYSFNEISERTRKLLKSEDVETVELNADQVSVMNEIWATIEIPNKSDFYYEAREANIAGKVLYFIKSSGFSAHSNGLNAAVQGLICLTEGQVIKKSANVETVYSAKDWHVTYFFNSSEKAIYEMRNCKQWLLPLPSCQKSVISALEIDVNAKISKFSEFVALAALPNGLEIVTKLVTANDVTALELRYAGAFSKILSCLSHRQYNILQIAHKLDLPTSTVSRFKIGSLSLMEFVRRYKAKIIARSLEHEPIGLIASREGYSSKYKMLSFIKKYGEEPDSIGLVDKE